MLSTFHCHGLAIFVVILFLTKQVVVVVVVVMDLPKLQDHFNKLNDNVVVNRNLYEEVSKSATLNPTNFDYTVLLILIAVLTLILILIVLLYTYRRRKLQQKMAKSNPKATTVQSRRTVDGGGSINKHYLQTIDSLTSVSKKQSLLSGNNTLLESRSILSLRSNVSSNSANKSNNSCLCLVGSPILNTGANKKKIKNNSNKPKHNFQCIKPFRLLQRQGANAKAMIKAGANRRQMINLGYSNDELESVGYYRTNVFNENCISPQSTLSPPVAIKNGTVSKTSNGSTASVKMTNSKFSFGTSAINDTSSNRSKVQQHPLGSSPSSPAAISNNSTNSSNSNTGSGGTSNSSSSSLSDSVSGKSQPKTNKS